MNKRIPEVNRITKYFSRENIIDFGTKTTIKKEVDSVAQLNQINTINLNKSKTPAKSKDNLGNQNRNSTDQLMTTTKTKQT